MNWKNIVTVRPADRNAESKPLSFTQILRHTAQIAGFLLLPGLFLLTLGSVKGVWQALLHGQFTWAAMGAPLLTLLAIIPITALWGRFFCGYLCAFGGLQELLHYLAQRLHLPRVELSPAADRIARKAKYAVLGVLFLLWTFDVSYDSASPWNVFGQYATYDGWVDLSKWLSVGGALLLLIAAAGLFTERAFCRYLCPLGGVFSLLSRGRLFRVKRNQPCVGCAQCEAACPMGVNVARETGERGSVYSAECIDCFRCVDKCGVKALYTAPREALSGSVAALAIAGMAQVGTVVVKSPIGVTSGIQTLSQGQFTDGTYIGSAQGYRGPVNVQVRVSGGKIVSITVESYQDDSQFFERAKESVISAILAGQTTDVSVVSGATYSSRGIMQAVANALGIQTQSSDEIPTIPRQDGSDSTQEHHSHSKPNGGEGGNSRSGRKHSRSQQGSSNDGGSNSSRSKPNSDSSNNSLPQIPDNSQKSENSQIAPSTSLDFSNLTDGTYSGTGRGRNGNIAVTVKVKGGKVTSITVESSSEDAQYFNRAKDTVIGEILDSQSLNVRTVSGATMSSNGILDAVANALGLSFTNPNASRGGRH